MSRESGVRSPRRYPRVLDLSLKCSDSTRLWSIGQVTYFFHTILDLIHCIAAIDTIPLYCICFPNPGKGAKSSQHSCEQGQSDSSNYSQLTLGCNPENSTISNSGNCCLASYRHWTLFITTLQQRGVEYSVVSLRWIRRKLWVPILIFPQVWVWFAPLLNFRAESWSGNS